jgi:hypothetical protein
MQHCDVILTGEHSFDCVLVVCAVVACWSDWRLSPMVSPLSFVPYHAALWTDRALDDDARSKSRCMVMADGACLCFFVVLRSFIRKCLHTLFCKHSLSLSKIHIHSFLKSKALYYVNIIYNKLFIYVQLTCSHRLCGQFSSIEICMAANSATVSRGAGNVFCEIWSCSWNLYVL